MNVIQNNIYPQNDLELAKESDAESFLQMKNDDGSDLFPFERIKYNSERGVRLFLIHHFLNLPYRWNPKKRREPDHDKELRFKCPICEIVGDDSEVKTSYLTAVDGTIYFKHKCERCGFSVSTQYSSTDEEHMKDVRENYYTDFIGKLIDSVQLMEIERINSDNVIDSDKKIINVKERAKFWTKFKEDAGLY